MIPFGNDAALKHYPFTTCSLIIANFTIFFALPDLMAIGTLQFGELNPIQWLLANFSHADEMHLLGNMIFLFVFGVIVENRIGSWKFAALYLGIGIYKCMLVQIIALVFQSQGGCLGASGAIYGIMMVALLWCPEDNLRTVSWIYGRFFFFEIPVAIFVAAYFLLDLGSAIFVGFRFSTPVLHVIGACVGFLVGLLVLLFDWVDCDDKDMVSRFRILFGIKKKKRKEAPTAEQLAEIWRSIVA